jgi:hypothetical protein
MARGRATPFPGADGAKAPRMGMQPVGGRIDKVAQPGRHGRSGHPIAGIAGSAPGRQS